jgi:two-component system, OmpR family, KDP operon response regulator KdpE
MRMETDERGPDTSGARVLVVEDEPHIRDLIALHLTLEGLKPVAVGDGEEGLRLARAEPFDLVVLDLMLPGLDGVTVCRAIRRDTTNSDVPILMLTARREESDKVLGLESGADDYLTKPFGVGELLARIRVALRHAARREHGGTSVTLGAIEIDLAKRLVHAPGGEIHLTPIEFRLLTCLAQHEGMVVTHRHLLREVWGPTHVEQPQYLRVYMKQLRQKLEPDPVQPRYLLTETGVGYRLVLGEGAA